MSELITWLREIWDEDDRVALAAGGATWHVDDDDARVEDANGEVIVYDEGSPTVEQAEHIARHDPARVLAEVAAKRQIIKLYEVAGASRELSADAWIMLREVVQRLVLPYANQPGYRDEWRP